MNTPNSVNKLWDWRDVVSVFRPTRLLFVRFEEASEEAKPAPRPRRVLYWLILSVAFLSCFVAGYCVVKYNAEGTIDPDQVRLVVEGLPNQGTATFAQAVQALSRRH
jgi:hypothetical protein